MGTRRSQHNYGRKPIYKEHRPISGAAPAEIRVFECIEIGDSAAFMGSPEIKALTIDGVLLLSEDSAKTVFEHIRWSANNGNPFCPRCGCIELYTLSARCLWLCQKCKYQFSATTGTFFGNHKAAFKALLVAWVNLLAGEHHASAGANAGMRQESISRIAKKMRNDAALHDASQTKGAHHEFVLGRPRYFGGLELSTRTNWSPQEKSALAQFAGSNASIESVATTLGRSEKSIAWYARDMKVPLPSDWAALVRPKKKLRTLRAPVVMLKYPYIQRSRPSDNDLLRVNDLVPKALPSWIRADVCQSIMLALYEGHVELRELQSNKAKVAEFIRKFYREQMPSEEISLEGRYVDDDRDSYEVAAAMSGADWEQSQMREKRGTFAAMAQTFHAPEQINDLYAREVTAAHWASFSRGEDYSREEIRELLDAGEIGADLGAYLRSPHDSHASDRLKERSDAALSVEMAAKVRRYCQSAKPVQRANGDAYYLVPINGKAIPVIYDPARDVIKTVLPERAAFVRGHRISQTYGQSA